MACFVNCGMCVALVAVGLPVCIYLFLALRKWLSGGVCTNKTTLKNKTVIITGCNTGIGKETVKDLAKRGAHVIMACRDMKKAEATAEEIKKENPHAKITKYQLDLASLKSIREFAKTILEKETKIHILINNAGVMWTPYLETEDGFEMQFGTNHLGHFLLTNLLLDKIKTSAPSRIINVSSLGHTFGKMHWSDLNMKENYSSFAAYAQSKLANILFTKELAKRLEGTGVTTYALHPGSVFTELSRHFQEAWNKVIIFFMMRILKVMCKTPLQGAQTSIYCATEEKLAKESGLYYSDCAKKEPSKRAQNDEDAKKLWDHSAIMVKL